MELEVRVADDWAEFENFASPPVWFGGYGPGSKFTTPSGQNMPSPVTGRYAQIRATLTGTTTATPSLSDIQLECNRSSAVESKVIRYRFDEAGNILEVTTDTRYGRRSDKRDDPNWDPEERLNNLNQIMRQDIDGDSWDFTWDANGNLTSKTNGSESYTYVWNEDNRLTQVSWDGGVGGYHAARFHSGKYHAATGVSTQWTVDYTYDSAGRMLTRDDGTNLTKFYWDGFDMVREVTGESVTEYLIPQGMLLSFKRDGVVYHASCDALGSVRLVTDEEGEVVSRFEYGAYGELLAGSFDGVPRGMPYTWVGALGVRRDELTGLLYMRQRWYDSGCQRFVSKDPIGVEGGANLYTYAQGNPVKLVDPSGLCPFLEKMKSVGYLLSWYARRQSWGLPHNYVLEATLPKDKKLDESLDFFLSFIELGMGMAPPAAGGGMAMASGGGLAAASASTAEILTGLGNSGLVGLGHVFASKFKGGNYPAETGFNEAHIVGGHTPTGNRAGQSARDGGNKTYIPGFSAQEIMNTVRRAWNERQYISRQWQEARICKDTGVSIPEGWARFYKGIDPKTRYLFEMWLRPDLVVDTAYTTGRAPRK